MSTSSNPLAPCPAHTRRRRRRHACVALVSALVFFAALLADSPRARAQGTPADARPAPQSPAPTPDTPNDDAGIKSKGTTGSITGRVLGDGGEPLAGARVLALTAASNRSNIETTATADEGGNFRIDNLAPGLYQVNAAVRGHVADPETYPTAGRPAPLYRPGDSVTIRLVRGGVVTGTVTGGDGEPLVAISVRAYYVRDLEGDASTAGVPYLEDQTDDRGVYRIYGLRQGVYVVAAAGADTARASWPGTASPYRNESPTYYPSATRDTATELTVRAGQETAGIDIRHRGDRGRRVTGVVLAPAQGGADTGALVTLTHAATGTQVGTTFTQRSQGAGERPFSFESVADGEYEVQARTSEGGYLVNTSEPKRVVVGGSDQTGLRLTLTPLASVSGSLIIEPSGEADRAKPECKATHTTLLPQESVVTAQHEDISKRSPAAARRATLRRETAPDSSGAFTLRALEQGRYRLDARLADDNWYVRDVQLPATAASTTTPATAASTRPGAARRPGSATAPTTTNAAAPRDTVELKTGQQLSGVVVRVAEGAASLAGRLAPREENAPLPPAARLRVHLVPAARELAENALRYHEATPAADGSFVFRNLAPGRYFVFAREAETEAASRPAAWDSASRARLRREAEAANISAELQPCQRATDFALRFPQESSK